MTPANPPCELAAGDSIAWRVSLPEYPAPDWQLRYRLISAHATHAIAAAPDGDAHQVTLSSEDTSEWPPGRYQLVEYVQFGGYRHTLRRLDLLVTPDPLTAAPADTRSHARKVVEAIEAFLETGDAVASQVQIADRRIASIPIPDLLKLLDRYRAELKRECGSGGPVGRIYTRY